MGTQQYTPTTQRIPLDRGLQWGSDPNFCYHGFSCPIGSWTEERLVRNAMRNMAYMASSVKAEFNLDFNISDYINDHRSEETDVVRLNGLNFSPTERVDDLRSPTPPSTASPSSTSSPRRQEVDLQPPNKKRKCVQKPGQKLCHCRSEKKRREAVSQGYRDLSQVVPGLEGQNFTRKYVLNATAQYLEQLLHGNEDLKRQLGEMKDQEEKDIEKLLLGCESEV
jgi:hypothetical protein